MRTIFFSVLIVNLLLLAWLYVSYRAKDFPDSFKLNYGEVSAISHFTPTPELRKRIHATEYCTRFYGFADMDEAVHFIYLLHDFSVSGFVLERRAPGPSGASRLYVGLADREAWKYRGDREIIDPNIQRNFKHIHVEPKLPTASCN